MLVITDDDIGDVAITGSTGGSVHAFPLSSSCQLSHLLESQDETYDTRPTEGISPGVDIFDGCLVGVMTGPRPGDRVSGVTCWR